MIKHATTVGRRLQNEDTFKVGKAKTGWYHTYVGVFDGHGGDEVSNMCRDNLERTLEACGYDLTATVRQLHDMTSTLPNNCGATAIVALIGRSSVRVACAGDSSAFVVDENGRVTRITKMHLASDETESANIVALGGEVKVVRGVSRVGGSLMVSRSIGDRYLVGVNHTPEISQFSINRSHKWLVFVTDGVTDVLSEELIGKIILQSDGDPSALVQASFDGMSMDNCTSVVVDLV